MKFIATPLAGAWVIEPEPIADDRGYFARTYCVDELGAHGLTADPMVQASVSFNRARGTLRGMHFQRAPHAETKLVSCVQGEVYDVIVDLRASSATFRAWYGVHLSPQRMATLYVPAGFAHGFLTLTDDAVVSYQMTVRHHPAAAGGLRWDDPAFGITWPTSPMVISERDRGYPDFES